MARYMCQQCGGETKGENYVVCDDCFVQSRKGQTHLREDLPPTDNDQQSMAQQDHLPLQSEIGEKQYWEIYAAAQANLLQTLVIRFNLKVPCTLDSALDDLETLMKGEAAPQLHAEEPPSQERSQPSPGTQKPSTASADPKAWLP